MKKNILFLILLTLFLIILYYIVQYLKIQSLPPTGLIKEGMIFFNWGNKSFYLDEILVTTAQFRKFTEEYKEKTGSEYITLGETQGGTIQDLQDKSVLDVRIFPWLPVDPKYNWRTPRGVVEDVDNHPVTQIVFQEAQDFCNFYNKRLPTEAEWEYAAKNAEDKNYIYPWGDDELAKEIDDGHNHTHKQILANVWQPLVKSAKSSQNNNKSVIPEDGYLYTSPVKTYTASKSGVFDMVGNVWQITSTDFFPTEAEIEENPDLAIPIGRKVVRGGSFLCHQNACHGFTVVTKNNIDIDLPTFHTASAVFKGFKGFSCFVQGSTLHKKSARSNLALFMSKSHNLLFFLLVTIIVI